MKLKLTSAVIGALASVVALGSPAFATPPAGTGYDEIPDLVAVGGSDTSYFVSNLVANLYNQSPGCSTRNSTSPVDVCVAGQTAPTPYANWDHDVFAGVFPVGSGSGRNQLNGTLTGTNPIDLVRSSSGKSSGQTLVEFASEGVAIVAVNPAAKGRTTSTIAATKAQLQAIYSTNAATCGGVTWAQLGDTGPNASDLVLPFGMNTGSGTRSTFQSEIGFDPNTGACVNGHVPFENDVAELKKITSSVDNLPRYNSGQGIWWISGATMSAFPVLGATLSPMKYENQSYTDTTNYTYVRNVSFVARGADVAFTASGLVDGTGGATAGKPGAVREFLRWLCRGNAGHTLDSTIQSQATGRNFNLQITGLINRAGFNPTVKTLSASTFSSGRCKGS
jgi:hypothetical protein